MKKISRLKFIQSAAVLGAAAVAGMALRPNKPSTRLAFSTLGCPDWSFEKILDFAVAHGYHGIELRGIRRELDLTKCVEFANDTTIGQSLRLVKERNLTIVDLGSSATLHFAAGMERSKNLDEGRRFIDLAQKLECPFVRVFPNNFIGEQTKQQTMELIAAGLVELANHATGANVKVLLETHGDLVHVDDLHELMEMTAHGNLGLIWDVTNMWTMTKELPEKVYTRLKPYIHHVHIKDAVLVDGKPQYTLLGKGAVPIMDAVSLLYKHSYMGHYSFEWEKMWHPELADPEIALADFPLVMNRHFKGLA